MAHQVVLALRSGKYQADGRTAPPSRKVALAGHAYGGQIAQVEAYSFGDIDGLIVLAYADPVQSARLKAKRRVSREGVRHGRSRWLRHSRRPPRSG